MHQHASREGTLSLLLSTYAAQVTQISSPVQASEFPGKQPASSRRRSRTADSMRPSAYLVVKSRYLPLALSDLLHKTLLFEFKYHS